MMKLTEGMCRTLLDVKYRDSETRVKELLTAAGNPKEDKLKAAELSLDKFKKEIAGLKAEKDRIAKEHDAHQAKCRSLREQISKVLGDRFTWELDSGVSYAYRHRSLHDDAYVSMEKLIKNAIMDLQIAAIGAKGETVQELIAEFRKRDFAKEAVDRALADRNQKE